MSAFWISVKTKLPALKEDYGCCSDKVLASNGFRVFMAYIVQYMDGDEIEWRLAGPDGLVLDDITHWTPLPNAPDGNAGNQPITFPVVQTAYANDDTFDYRINCLNEAR